MGLPGQTDHPDVVRAIERVAKASRAHDVPWSILPKDAALANRCIEWGCSMLSIGHDCVALYRGLASYAEDFESLQSR
jgi:2-keto-3-deoxy-L-rhamnonate aldolase RhmA